MTLNNSKPLRFTDTSVYIYFNQFLSENLHKKFRGPPCTGSITIEDLVSELPHETVVVLLKLQVPATADERCSILSNASICHVMMDDTVLWFYVKVAVLGSIIYS